MKNALLAIVLSTPLLVGWGNDCNKEYRKELSKLSPSHQAYYLKENHGETTIDIDGDGIRDRLWFTSKRAVRDCDDYTKMGLLVKNNYVRFDYGNGRARVFDWNGGLMQSFTLRPKDRILVATGITKDNEAWTKEWKY